MNNSGFLLIDKPPGITSFQVISRLRKITSIKRIGHTGTLDPFATGLLPVCIGSATRLADFISSARKTYLAEIKFGIRTDTGDITGNIISTQPLPQLDQNKLNFAVSSLLQLKEQTPPSYSAIKVNGKRAYDLARQGKEVILMPRPINIFEFRIIDFNEQSLTYQTTVSKGTYIRTLSESLALLLGTMATTTKLVRLAVDNIQLNDAVPLEHLNPQNWQNSLLPPSEILRLPQLLLDDNDTDHFYHGRPIPITFCSDKIFLVLNKNTNSTLGIAHVINENILQPDIVLPG